MQQFRLEHSPITYYLSGREQREWVLFLHAAFVDHNMFREQISYFQKRYNVLTLDIIGHGQSTDTKKGDSILSMSPWLSDILKKEQIDRIHIAGVSLGAVLAQDFANRYPHAVKSLACFGGYDINNFDPGMQKENAAAQMRMMAKALFSVKWFAKANKKISAYTAQAQNDFYEMNLKFPKKSFQYLASLQKMVNRFPSVLRNYPLLIGCGAFDIPAEHTAVDLWKAHEPDCSVAILEHAGHCANMDAPNEFNKVLDAFFTNPPAHCCGTTA